MVEQMLDWFDTCHGIRSVRLRYFNAAGASADGKIGEDWTVTLNLVPIVMKALLGAGPELTVFGTDYPTPDGTAIRDYIHVTDLAAAHVAALKLLETGHAGGSFNLGTGSGFSVREILNAIRQETGREVPHTMKPRRAGDPTYLVADASAARKVLNFVPRHSDLKTVIRTAWAWHQTAHPLRTR